MRFVSLDCETANPNCRSICQIGAVVFEKGKIIYQFNKLINPQEIFSQKNISIHGITSEQVSDSPLFSDIIPDLIDLFEDSPITHYGHFDRTAFLQAGFPDISNFFDITYAVRKILQLESGYKLNQICERFNITLDNHHDALADAKAAGLILLECLNYSKYNNLMELLQNIPQGFGKNKTYTHQNKKRYHNYAHNKSAKISTLEIAENGVFKGETICFTGDLISYPIREEAQKLVAQNGGNISQTVTKKTTILVIGNYPTITNKEKKARELISNGQKIKLITENEWLKILNNNNR